MNVLTTVLPAAFALVEKVTPILIDAINAGLSKEEIRAQIHAAADEFVDAVVGERDRIEADDQAVLDAIDAFRRGA